MLGSAALSEREGKGCAPGPRSFPPDDDGRHAVRRGGPIADSILPILPADSTGSRRRDTLGDDCVTKPRTIEP